MGPCGAEVGVILVSFFSTESSRCAACYKKEADMSFCVSLCCKIASCCDYFVRLSNFHVLVLLRRTLSIFCFDTEKVDKRERK